MEGAFHTFAQDILRLKRLRRAGFLHFGLPDAEHIADHSFAVAIWVMVLADEMGLPENEQLEALKMALLHELGECRLGDLHYEARELLGPQQVQQAEQAAVYRVLSPLPAALRDRYARLWEAFEEGESLAARVVRAADRLDLLLQTLHYEHLTGYRFDAIWNHPSTRAALEAVEPAKQWFHWLWKTRESLP
jgi:putative hydrolase of HD superfamily